MAETNQIFEVDREGFEQLIKSESHPTLSALATFSDTYDGGVYRVSKHTIGNFTKGKKVSDNTILNLARLLNVDLSIINGFRWPRDSPEEAPPCPAVLIPLVNKLTTELEDLHFVERTLQTVVKPSQTVTAYQILKSKTHCIILGEPGIGKTTLLKKLQLEAAKKGMYSVYIDLRGIRNDFEALNKRIRAEFKRQAVLNLEDIGDSPILFLFDHLDQTRQGFDSLLSEWVDEREIAGNIDRVVVGCRINSDYVYVDLKRHMTPLILSELQVDEITSILKWNGIEKLHELEDSNNRLLRFGENPYRLKLLVDIHKNRTSEADDVELFHEVDIYQSYIRHRIDSEVMRYGTNRISSKLKIDVIASLAFQLLMDDKHTISVSNATEHFLTDIPVKTKKQNIILEDGDIRRTINQIFSEGVVTLTDDSHFLSFEHDTLREFLSAWHMAHGFDDHQSQIFFGELYKNIEMLNPHYEQVLYFYVSLINDATSLLDYLTSIITTEDLDDYFHRILIDIGKCINLPATIKTKTKEHILDLIVATYMNTDVGFVQDELADIIRLSTLKSAADRILKLLENQDRDFRIRALRLTSKTNDERIVQRLIELYPIGSYEFDDIILSTLSHSKSRKAKSFLIEQLKEPRYKASDELVDFSPLDLSSNELQILSTIDIESYFKNINDEYVFDELLEAQMEIEDLFYSTYGGALREVGKNLKTDKIADYLNHSDIHVRELAIGIMGTKEDECAVVLLANKLAESKNENERAYIVQSLVETGSNIALPAIESILTPSNAYLLQDSIGGYLREVRAADAISPLIELLKNTDEKSQAKVISVLGRMLRENPNEILFDSGNFDDFEKAIVNALEKVADEISPYLISQFELGNEYVNKDILLIFKKVKRVETLISILQDLGDDDWRLECEIIIALGEMGSKEAIILVSKRLESSNPDIQQRAIYALRKIDNQSAIDSIINAGKSNDLMLRRIIAKSLFMPDREEFKSLLLNYLQDKDTEVKKNACFSLTMVKDVNILQALEKLLKDDNREIRLQVLKKLRIADYEVPLESLIKCLNDDVEIQKEAIFFLEAVLKLSKS